ncbi:intermembrane phospholipid transport protein YdbH family protein [Hyphococcus sp.]|uniref:intermembrane phospholipid transport protein YdbH family protein n=2 Tax=Hyphococcus sp. TaxID=2038636 RepID=UPI0035C6AF86
MRAARFLAVVLALAALLAAGVWFLRMPLAGWAVRTGMASAGLEAPEARVTALTFDTLRLENVAAGPQGARGVSFDVVEADFDWRRLWKERAVDAVRAGPGTARLTIDDEGRVSVPGVNAGGGGEGGALPFDRLTLSDVAVIVDAPEGAARGRVTADYDVGEGGDASIELSSQMLRWKDVVFENLDGAADLVLASDGAASIDAQLTGDIVTDAAAAKDIAISLAGEGRSWRDIAGGARSAFAGEGRIEFAAPDIELRAENLQALASAAQMQTIFGENLQRAALAGTVDIAYDADGVTVRLAGEETPLALTSPEGASLSFAPQGSAPFFAAGGGRQSSSFQFALKSAGANATGAVDMERQDGVWRVAAPLHIAAFSSDAISLGESRILLGASGNGPEIVADIDLETALRKATIGRLMLADAPFRGAFHIAADLNAQRATISSKSDCFTIDKSRSVIAQQEIFINLTGVTLCNAEGPLVTYRWNDESVFDVSGELAAQQGSFAMGETKARGRPPVTRFDAVYRPARKETTIAGGLANGDMILNEALGMAGVIGDFRFDLDADDMRAEASLDRLRLSQHLGAGQTLVMIAPVLASGEAVLEENEAAFSYVLTTPEGYRLGRGTGVHHMKDASGETLLTLEKLTFSPGGLQPNKISPALKGIVTDADGAMDGTVRFAWGGTELQSGADLAFNEISFAGPTQAVTRTNGVSGSVQLTDLFPVTTGGFQTITVDSVDMDALQLGQGAITFSLPGDESITISNAEFPWFGGTLGVYEAKAGFAGEATIPLRARGVDLEKIFDYVDIEGLSGEGVLTGELPVIFEGGKARIENGYFKSEGPGAIRYVGKAAEAASAAGEDAQVAFDILRDLRFNALEVSVNGALDGRLEFQMKFEGTGDVTVRKQDVRVPVVYRINLDAALLELLHQANLSRDIQLQIQRGLANDD